MTDLGTPKGSQKWKKREKRPFQNQTEKNAWKKTPQMKKKIAEGTSEGTSQRPPLPPTPAEPPRRSAPPEQSLS